MLNPFLPSKNKTVAKLYILNFQDPKITLVFSTLDCETFTVRSTQKMSGNFFVRLSSNSVTIYLLVRTYEVGLSRGHNADKMYVA